MHKTREWNKDEIKAEIIRRGVTLADLARQNGLTPTALSMSMTRRKAMTRADQVISQFIGVPMHELWPDRYDAHGHRLVKIKPLKVVRPQKRTSSRVAAE